MHKREASKLPHHSILVFIGRVITCNVHMRFNVTSNAELILVIVMHLNPSKSTTIDGQVVLISVCSAFERRQRKNMLTGRTAFCFWCRI